MGRTRRRRRRRTRSIHNLNYPSGSWEELVI
jgi:hypothetical protein